MEQSKDIGLWVKEGKKGKYFAGKMPDGTPIFIFKNDKKVTGSNQPDYRMKFGEIKPQARPSAAVAQPKAQPAKAVPNLAPQSNSDDELPF